jgi:hypothetical protein
VAALRAVNVVASLLLSPSGQTRVSVPFSPYCVTRVRFGRVASIVSTGDTIQGTLKKNVRDPTGERKTSETKLFTTQIPTF